MEGRGAAGVKNIARQMNYPLPSRGEKKPIGANNSSKKNAQNARKKDRMRCFREKGL